MSGALDLLDLLTPEQRRFWTRVYGEKGSAKGGAAKPAYMAPTSNRSNALATVIDLLSEGEIESVLTRYLDETPVVNADGSENFKGIRIEGHNGTPDQPELFGDAGVGTPFAVSAQVKQKTGRVVRNVKDQNATSVRVIMTVPALYYLVDSGKSPGTYNNSVNYRIWIRPNNGQPILAVDQSLNGKWTSGYQKSHTIELPAGGYPWAIEVERVSADSDNDNSQNATQWDSYIELVQTRLNYSNSAVQKMTVDASLFGTSIPARSYKVRGLKIRVPSNYDPVARTYNGIWDGTFKIAWTNNPAWVLYDLITNTRYGLGEFVDASKVDVAGLYTIAQYCDQLVDDGFGKMEPRYVFNGVLNTLEEAYKVLQNITSAFRGMSFWSLGQIFAVADMPKDAKVLVSPANVIGGHKGFEYQGTALKARHTVAMISWNDPGDFFRSTPELVRHDEALIRYGWRQTDIQAHGCTSRGQAVRFGRWILDSEQTETETVTYTASFDHAALMDGNGNAAGVLPGDIVAIADPNKAQVRAAGRVVETPTRSQIRLDAPFEMAAGVAYTIKLTTPEGEIVQYPVSSIDKDGLCTVAATMDRWAQPGGMWMIAGSDVNPRLYRVLSRDETAPNEFKITALFYDPQKFDRVERGLKLDPISYFRPKKTIKPVTNLDITESQVIGDGGVARTRLSLSWTPGDDFQAFRFLVSADTPTGFKDYGEISTTSIDIEDPIPGEHVFYVTARSHANILSAAASKTYTVRGWAGLAGPSVANLRVKGGGTQFSGRTASLEWDVVWPAGQPAYALDFHVRVFDADTNRLIHDEIAPQANWAYTYDQNVNDGGPRRRFRVTVAARDIMGSEGEAAVIVVQNPPPAMVIPSLIYTTQSVAVNLAAPTDPDYAGVLVWMSKVAGFNPLATTPAFDGASSNPMLPAEEDTTYYVRVARYDAFGKNPVELNISPEQSIRTNKFPVDTVAPDIPTGLTLTTGIDVAADGGLTAWVKAVWNPVGSKNMGSFDFEMTEGNGVTGVSWIRQRVDAKAPTFTWRNLKVAQLYSAHVRSVNSTNIAESGFSPIVSITTPKNDAAPGAPTNVIATGLFSGTLITWTLPGNRDLKTVEVWGGAGNATTPQVKLVELSAATATWTDPSLTATLQRRYWVRVINTSDVASPFAGGALVTAPQLEAAQIKDGILEETKFAASLVPPKVVDALPNAATSPLNIVLLKTDGKLYRKVNGQWTSELVAADVKGQLQDYQLAAISASKVAGALDNASIKAAQISTALSSSQIASLDAAKLYGGLSAEVNRNIDLGKAAGQVTSAQIVNLDAAKVAGALVNATLTASQINGGVLSADRLPAYDAAKLLWTTPGVSVPSAAVVGALVNATLDAGRIQNQLQSWQIAGISAAQLTTKITQTNVADDAIDTPQLRAGAVKTAQLFAGAVTASKLQVASVNQAFNADLSQLDKDGFPLGWWIGSGNTGINPIFEGVDETFAPAGLRAFRLRMPSVGAPNTVAEIGIRDVNTTGGAVFMPVRANTVYEISAYLSAHRCNAFVGIVWWTSNGTYITESWGNSVVNWGGGYGQSMAEWEANGRSRLIVRSPANAVSCELRVRFGATWVSNGVTPNVMVSGLMFATAAEGQTEVSPYVDPGVTTIGGGSILTGSLHANRIVARTIKAEHIDFGTLTGDLIDSNTILGRSIRGNEITAGHLTAFSVTASKMAIASTNLVFNSNGAQVDGNNRQIGAAIDQGTTNGGSSLQPLRTDNAFPGTYPFCMRPNATPGNGQWSQIMLRRLDASGNSTGLFPVVGGQRYEFSAYLAAYDGNAQFYVDWADANGAGISRGYSSESVPSNVGRRRVGGFATAPGNAAYAALYAIIWWTGGTNGHLFVSAPMMASKVDGQPDELSPYVDSGVTQIDGSSVRTGSLHATKITAGSIDASRLDVADVRAKVITANSIQAHELTIANRQIQLVGFDFQINAKTGVISWGGGDVYWTNDSGQTQGVSVSGGSFTKSGVNWYSINWLKGRTWFDVSTDVNFAINNGKDWLCIAVYDNSFSGLDVKYGNTRIDGDRILTGSIEANRIVTKSLTSAQINVDELRGNILIANSVTTSMLQVASANRAFNANGAFDLRGWIQGGSTWGGAVDSGIETYWVPSGFKGFRAHAAGWQQGGYFDGFNHWDVDANGNARLYPCVGGQRYEFSATFTAHRCTAELWVIWFDQAGTNVRNDVIATRGDGGITGGSLKDGRIGGIVTSPGTASGYRVLYRGGNVNGADPYIFVTAPMYGPVTAEQTQPSNYVDPGVTFMDGAKIITGSVKADQIDAGQIYAKHIVGGEIQTRHLAAGSVVTDTLGAGAITASKLTLTDPSNMVLNGDFLDGKSDAWDMGTNSVIEYSGSETDPGGRYRLRSNGRDNAYSNKIWVTPGDDIYCSAMVYNENGERAQLMALFTDGNGGNGNWQVFAYTDAKHQWVRIQGQLKVPTGAQRMQVLLQTDKPNAYGSWTYWGKVQCRRASSTALIVDGAIQARHLEVDSVTAGAIRAGAVGVDELSAGSVVSNKIGVGLNTTNLIFNSDFMLGGNPGETPPNVSWWTNDYAPAFSVGINNSGASWEPAGMRSLQVYCGSSPSGTILDTYLNAPRLDGSWGNYPALTNRRYEASVYLSAHRCRAQLFVQAFDANGNECGTWAGDKIDSVQSSGPLNNWARSKVFFTTPGNAARMHVFVRTEYYGAAGPYTFITGAYMAPALENQSQYSDWAAGATTVITGAGIMTGSITAKQIRGDTITGELIRADQIIGTHVRADTLEGKHLRYNSVYADRIQVGGGQNLTSWLGGPNNTQINGGAISANSIDVNKMKIGARGLNIQGIEFQANAGNYSVSWSDGRIGYVDDNGNFQEAYIPAGTAPWGGWVTIGWFKGRGWLDWANDNVGGWHAWDAHPDFVPFAVYTGATGLVVTKGGTILDGSKIVTGSIRAGQIAVGEINAEHLGVGTIQARHIGAGQVSADKISGGVISAGTITLNDPRFVLECYSGQPRMYVRDTSGNLRILMGQTSGFTPRGGDWGICMWGNDNTYIFGPDGVNGEGIWVNSIQANRIETNSLKAKIGDFDNLIARSAQIGQLVVGTENVADGAITTIASGSSMDSYGEVYVNNRRGRPLMISFGWQGSNGGYRGYTPGPIQLWCNDRFVVEAFPTMGGDGLWTPFFGQAADNPGWGVYRYSIRTPQGGGGWAMVIQEYAK